MAMQSGLAVSGDVNETSRAIDAPDFLNKLAEDLRAKSGSGLPLSCFVEQVKLQLAGGRTPQELSDELKAKAANSSNECFRAWAMPE